MRTALAAPSKSVKTILVFRYGEYDLIYPESSSPTEIRVALGTEPITWEGQTCIPMPAIEVDLPTRTGGVEESECKITIPTVARQHPLLQSMAQALASVRTCYPVTVKIVQIVRSAADHEAVLHLYRGRMLSVTRNPRGMRGILELEFKSDYRSRLTDIAMGIQANATCGMPFGQLCGALTTSRMELFGAGEYYTPSTSTHRGLKRNAWVVLTVDSLYPRRVAFRMDTTKHASAPSDPNATNTLKDQPPGWWVGSMLCKNGLRIPIKEWRWAYGGTQGTNVFVLQKSPPDDWHGASVFLRLDCSKDYLACAARLNGENFGGIGRDIPAYNPTVSLPED